MQGHKGASKFGSTEWNRDSQEAGTRQERAVESPGPHSAGNPKPASSGRLLVLTVKDGGRTLPWPLTCLAPVWAIPEPFYLEPDPDSHNMQLPPRHSLWNGEPSLPVLQTTLETPTDWAPIDVDS